MRAMILAEPDRYRSQKRVTTGDIARLVERTRRGARWIADQEQLPYERTESGIRLYRMGEVQRLLDRRAEARLRKVTALRPRMAWVRGEPRQLPLVPIRQGSALPTGEVQHAESGGKSNGPDNPHFGNQRARGTRP